MSVANKNHNEAIEAIILHQKAIKHPLKSNAEKVTLSNIVECLIKKINNL